MVEKADVVVIGGGAVGTAVAYYLARKRLDVILVEKAGIAAGSSGRCDGNVMLNDTLPGYDCQLKKMSQDLFPVLARDLDVDFEWRRRGSVLVIETEAEMAFAREYCLKMQALGLPARIIEQRDMLNEEPFLARDILGGMEMACDGSLNPMAFAQGLAAGVRRLGGRIRTNTAVRAIGRDFHGRVQTVDTDRGSIDTPCVVNAAGVWAGAIGRMVDLDLPIKPRQGQLLVGERTFRLGKRKLQEFGYMMPKFERSDYQRNLTPEMQRYGIAFVYEPTIAGTFLIGSSRWFSGNNLENSMPVLRCMAQRAMRFLPALRRVHFIRAYAGLRPYSPDHFPIVSQAPVPGFYVAAGHEGNGIGLAPITGKLIAQLITGESPCIDMQPLHLKRFGAKAAQDGTDAKRSTNPNR